MAGSPWVAALITPAAPTAAPVSSRVTVVSAPTSSLVAQVSAGRLTLAAVLHPAVLDGLEAGPVTLLPTLALVPTSMVADDGSELKLRQLDRLPIAVRPRAEAPAARDLFLDTLALHRPDGGTVVVTDERAGLAMAAAGQAAVVTADPALAGPGVGRHRLADDPLPLRLRLVWSRTRTPFLRPDDVMAQLTDALVAS